MTTLIVCRHGNTFDKGDTLRRVGGRTDIPLSSSGQVQARAIGHWLKQSGLHPDAVYSSQLQRTKQTAELALAEAGIKEPVFPLAIFNEIDYGPDENRPEDEVKARLGEQALKDWDEKAIVADGWVFDPAQCIDDLKKFAAHMIEDKQDCVMVVTSNGIARFLPHLTGDFDGFAAKHPLKVYTGGICILSHDNGRWHILGWNVNPMS